MTIGTAIPEDKLETIKQACYSIALNIRDEDPEVANHEERVAMANDLIRTPGNKALKYAQVADSYAWATGGIDWATATDEEIKTAIIAVWDHIALSVFSVTPAP